MYRLWILLVSFQTTFAQDYLVTRYDVSDGLTDDIVPSIIQDKQGFIWFGTREGICRFDGKTFTSYPGTKSIGLFTREILGLTEYQPGKLVFYSVNRLVVFDTWRKEFSRPEHLREYYISNISTKGSRLFIGTVDSCLVLDSSLRVIDTIVPPLSNPGPLSIFALDDNTYFIGSGLDSFIYESKTRSFQRFDFKAQGLPDDTQLYFACYDQARKWIYLHSYFTGFYRFSLDLKLLKYWPMHGYVTMGQLNEKTFWMGNMTNDGLPSQILDIASDKTKILKLEGKAVLDAHTSCNDRDGNLWLGTSTGVIKLRPENKHITSWLEIEGKPLPGAALTGPGKPFRLTKGSDNNMYLSLFAYPWLYQLNQEKQQWELISKDISMPWAVTRFGDEIVFAGGETMNYSVFNTKTRVLRKSDGFLKKYFPDSDILILAFQSRNGDQWFSGNKGGGIVRKRAHDGGIDHYTTDSRSGKSLNGGFHYYSLCVEDSRGDLWFGVNKSWLPLKWSKAKETFTLVRIDSGQTQLNQGIAGFNAMVMDNYDGIWFACEGSGLERYDPQRKTLQSYTVEDGLPSNFVYALQFDGAGRLWIGTKKGLSCLHVKENRIVTFNRDNGLVDDRFEHQAIYYDSAENSMWIGASNAIMKFNPDSLLWEQPVNIQLDGILVNGKPYVNALSQENPLSYSQNNFQFRFVAPSFSNRKIEYSYMLIGQDEDWISSPLANTASYANLEPGQYCFSIRARYVGNNPWFTIQQPVSFAIATPWYKTWWFNGTVIAGSFFFVGVIARAYYARKMEKRLFALEKQQALEHERTRIATDMHDDFGANLSRIKFISEKIKLKKHVAEDLEADLTKISSFSNQMADKMNEIVWALNERFNSLDDLTSFTRAYAADYLSQYSITLIFEAEDLDHVMLGGEARRNVFLIIKEALHNTVKHAQASRVKILFQQQQNLRVVYLDDGKGFDPAYVRPLANGFVNMRKRVHQVGGSIEIDGTKGTRITIILPIEKHDRDGENKDSSS